MGIGYHDLRLMAEARAGGACFERILTIGRQSLCLHPSEWALLQQKYPLGAAPLHLDGAFGADAEPFLRAFLGARSVEALDYSAYQGAQHLHDMNQPVPRHLLACFDLVFDGGALEHIFNFPVAAANLMRMAKVGGHVFMSTPANNFLGHGFYQFSPELMYRVFTAENGFEVRSVQLLEARYPSPELTRNRTTYQVADPAQVHCRVGLLTKRPVLMLVHAKRIADRPIFERPPLQSDYVSEWARGASAPQSGVRASWRSRVRSVMPRAVQVALMGWAQRRRYSFANRDFFRRVR